MVDFERQKIRSYFGGKMKKPLALLAMFAMSNNASAITSEFTFDVLSSGPDIYVCNAGLRHINPAGSLSDRQGNGTVSTDDQGDYLQDVMEYRMGQWDIWTSQLSEGQDVRLRATGGSDYVTATGRTRNGSARLADHKSNFGSDTEKSNVLTYLKFEFSSERFGTEYFVDVCYYGPRFHSGPVGTSFQAKA